MMYKKYLKLLRKYRIMEVEEKKGVGKYDMLCVFENDLKVTLVRIYLECTR